TSVSPIESRRLGWRGWDGPDSLRDSSRARPAEPDALCGTRQSLRDRELTRMARCRSHRRIRDARLRSLSRDVAHRTTATVAGSGTPETQVVCVRRGVRPERLLGMCFVDVRIWHNA